MSDERDDWDEMDAMMQEYFLQLRRQYVRESAARLEELSQDLAACRARDPEALDSLKSRFHKLAGSGGSYGFPAITAASREAEEWIGEHAAPDEAGFAILERAIRSIAAAFAEAAREVGGDR
ncbi:MAG TPA: Hpt domain-containing protein [Gemmatimonadales bacterium]|nr:Hpt domain-containing protein [Gemmatimonadales bacterium]